MKLLPHWVVTGYLALVMPIGRRLASLGVTPNAITVTGTLFWVVGGVLYASGSIHWGGWLLGLTALFDVLDGEVARLTGRSSAFGAFLDSTLDRIADAAVLGGLAWFFATDPEYGSRVTAVACVLALLGAQMVSYTKARAESLGLECGGGFLRRPERVVLLSAPAAFFGLALNGQVLAVVIYVLAATSWLTVAQRIREVADDVG